MGKGSERSIFDDSFHDQPILRSLPNIFFENDFIDGSFHVAIYEFNDEKNEWNKSFTEASFFVCACNIEPFYGIRIDYIFKSERCIEPLTSDKEFKVDPPLLFYKNERNRTRCIRFKTADECNRISKLIERILKPVKKLPQQHQRPTGILSVLATAQELSYKTEPIPVSHPSSWQSAMSLSSMTTDVPNNQILSVDEIEKTQRKEQRTINNKSDIKLATPRPQLLLPTMIYTSKDIKSTPTPTTHPSNEITTLPMPPKVEPLTRNQLLQAVSYLIRTERDFVIKLHEAYLKSCTVILLK